jgi:transcriptional regulator with XRE-family HTH domain
MTVQTKKDNSFGKLIYKHRKKLGYRLVDVALATGKTKQKIHDYEQGNRNPPRDPIFLMRLSEYLNIPMTLLTDKSSLTFNKNNPKLKLYLNVIRDKSIAATIQDRMVTLRGVLTEIQREMVADGTHSGLQKMVEKARITLKDIEVSIESAA